MTAWGGESSCCCCCLSRVVEQGGEGNNRLQCYKTVVQVNCRWWEVVGGGAGGSEGVALYHCDNINQMWESQTSQSLVDTRAAMAAIDQLLETERRWQRWGNCVNITQCVWVHACAWLNGSRQSSGGFQCSLVQRQESGLAWKVAKVEIFTANHQDYCWGEINSIFSNSAQSTYWGNVTVETPINVCFQ